jgi:hypothetical protein
VFQHFAPFAPGETPGTHRYMTTDTTTARVSISEIASWRRRGRNDRYCGFLDRR